LCCQSEFEIQTASPGKYVPFGCDDETFLIFNTHTKYRSLELFIVYKRD
jgi:hypothetical protein